MLAALFRYADRPYNWKNLSFLFIAAFVLRALVFWGYVQHQERYCQPDSVDYHVAASSLAIGNGMFFLNIKRPLFWRTPGYPVYLLPFLKWYGLRNLQFSQNADAHKAAIWAQIGLCSLLPILIFFLALLLTGLLSIAWIAAWIVVFHVGHVLAATYLLTDALSMFFFIPFLYFFYASFKIMWHPDCSSLCTASYCPTSTEKHRGRRRFSYDVTPSLWHPVLAALFLGAYTWLRPNGQFLSILCVVILLFAYGAWKEKLKRIALFYLVFTAAIAPWCWRNYNLTGHWVFCPMSGLYLRSFNAPKIISRVEDKPLQECWQQLMDESCVDVSNEIRRLRSQGSPHFVINENICGKCAWPWIIKYPHYFAYDWFVEVCKTTFDLYGSQLVSFANNSFRRDPLVEFLPEKLRMCLYKQPMHPFMRLLCWLEFLFSLIVWGALFCGVWLFLLRPLVTKHISNAYEQHATALFLKVGIMIAGIVGMTGGFGYARLRMQADPLIVILALVVLFWWACVCYRRPEDPVVASR